MNIEQLMALRRSPDAPFNHEEFTVWLHNKIIELVREEIAKHRYYNVTDRVTYSDIENMGSLQIIEP